MTVTIYLVRHGETDHNASSRCQGNLDVPMNAVGEGQVAALAKTLAGVRFDAVVTSPLVRASKTARILVGESALPITEHAGLSEFSYGDWQGTSYSEWPSDVATQWRDQPWGVSFPNGEDLKTARARVMHALREIAEAHAGKTVLVTAHGHVNRLALLTLRNQSPEDFWQISTPNCSTFKLVVDITNNGELKLLHSEVVHVRVTAEDAQKAIDAKTKPLGSLGQLETCAVRLSVLQQTLHPKLDTARVCIFAADHGIADEGVSAYPRAVTAEMMKNFNAGGAAINVLGRANDVQVAVIDVGVDASLEDLSNILHAKVRNGSRNFLREPAMSEEELRTAMECGARAVREAAQEGVQAVGLGEMGIGNTTSASALLSCLTGFPPRETVGMGTGVSDEVYKLKCDVVSRAIQFHGFRKAGVPARECLRRVGGLEIAAITGAALEACRYPITIVADGFISTVAVLAAAFIAYEESADGTLQLAERVFVAHRSRELGHKLAIGSLGEALGNVQHPLLDLQMRLGEGSGAALAIPVLRSAAAIMREMATFESAGVSSSKGPTLDI